MHSRPALPLPLLLAALLLSPLLPGPVAATGPGLRISEVLPDPGDGREFIEIWNDATEPVNLTGWSIQDAAGSRYTFTDGSLPPDGRIVVWGGGADDAFGPAWNRAAVWNNDGDTVLLFDPSGVQRDNLTYGSDPAAPPTGTSLAWDRGAWIEADPTPGQPPDQDSGTITADVPALPPDVALDGPVRTAPGAIATVHVFVTDRNGDLAAWHLDGGGTRWREGDTTAEVDVGIPAPAHDLELTLTATDASGATNSTTWTLHVGVDRIVVTLPEGGWRLPPLIPGARDVTTPSAITIRNEGTDVVTPLFDLADLEGPTTIPMTGVLLGTDHGDGETWSVYEGPLTPLPGLAPNGTMQLRLRIPEVPSPLPPGTYGTSFTVVAG